MATKNVIEAILNLKIVDFLRNIKEAEGQTATSTGKMGKSVDDAGKKMENAFDILGMKSFREIRTKITEVEAAYKHLAKEGGLSVGELAKVQDQAKKKITELKNETNGWSSELVGLKDNVAALGAAFGSFLALKGAYQAFSDFEQKMAEVNTLLDVTPEKYEAVKTQVLALSTEIPQTAEELASASYDLVSAGVAVDGLGKSLELSGKAAVAGVTDTKTAVNAGISVINAYGMKIGDLETVYDKLFMTVKLGVTTFPALAASIGEVLPTARAAGVNIDEVAASIAAMTKAGIRTPQAVTALAGAIKALGIPAPETKKKLQELGITWNGLIGTLGQIGRLKLTAEQLRAIIPDEEALKAVLSLTQNFQGLTDILAQVTGGAGAMQAAYDKMKDTPENQMKLFRNELNLVGIELGGALAKGVLPFIQALGFLVSGLRNADPATKALLGGITVLLGGLILWHAGLNKIVGALGLLRAKLLDVAAGSTLANNALKASVVGAIVYATYEVGKLVVELGKLIKTQADLVEQSKAYGEAAKQFEQFKDFQIKGSEEIQKMNEKEHEAYKKGLRDRLQYLALTIAKMKTGVKDATAEMVGDQIVVTEVADQAGRSIEDLQKEYKLVRDAALSAGGAGAAALAEIDQVATKGQRSAEDAKKAIAALGQQYQTLSGDLGRAYDFAAQKAQALATSEQAGKDAALNIYRQKADTIIGEATRTAMVQLTILGNSQQDEKTFTDQVADIHRDLAQAKISALEEYQSKLRSSYLEAVNEAKRWGEESKRIEQAISDSRLSFADRSRELQRRTMTDEQAWNDQRKQAYEQLRQAQEALANAKTPDEMKTAAEMFQKAEKSAEGLVKEVKDGDKVIISMTKGFEEFSKVGKQAQEGYEAAMKAQDAYAKQRQEEALARAKTLEEELTRLQKQMDKINETELSPTVTFNVDATEVLAMIERLKQPTSSTHTIYVQKVETDHVGGWVGELHSGGSAWSLPSFSLPRFSAAAMHLKAGEVLAKLLRREFVLRPEASEALAPWLPQMNRLKNRAQALSWLSKLQLPEIPKFHEGGSVAAVLGLSDFHLPEIPSFHEGGSPGAWSPVAAGGDYGTLRLQAGDAELPVIVPGPTGREMIKTFEKELAKLRLTRGR